MLIVISPAKSLDFDSPLATRRHTEPELLDRSAELVEVMATRSPDEISELMHISPALGELNHERFLDWHRPFDLRNARQAVLAFAGDTYIGLDAANRFDTRDFTHASKVLRILSGLYGVLRPLDLIQPYRLEMGTQLRTERGHDLYEFWGSTITDTLNEALATSPGSNVLVNLASKEYFGAVRTDELVAPVVTPTFLDPDRSGELRTISFFAKRARGAMAGWIVANRVRSTRSLREFTELDYYDQELSEGYGYLTMRDGVQLSVMVRFPNEACTARALAHRDRVLGLHAVVPRRSRARGAARQPARLRGVGVNMRGSGCSGGVFDVFSPAQAADGYDVVETVARQPWVLHGRPGHGRPELPGHQPALRRGNPPPSLAAITPLSVIDDLWRQQWPGGIYNSGFTRAWLGDARPGGPRRAGRPGTRPASTRATRSPARTSGCAAELRLRALRPGDRHFRPSLEATHLHPRRPHRRARVPDRRLAGRADRQPVRHHARTFTSPHGVQPSSTGTTPTATARC
jgi:cytoplasmic iron level regulating protein YaaA (DUF328/UPF0246 family)